MPTPTPTPPVAPLALITGASRGIGRAIALRLASDGFDCILSARSVDQLTQTRSTIVSAHPARRVHVLPADLTSETSTRALTQHAQGLGHVTTIVHNAGVGGPLITIDQVAPDLWDQVMQVNVRAAYILARDLLPGMAQRTCGAFIAIASTHALVGAANSTAYCAAKHALLGLTRALAAEWGRHGITANAVCPGYTRTDMIGAYADNPTLLAAIPRGHVNQPDEVAALVGFLASPAARAINGAALTIDGGMLASL